MLNPVMFKQMIRGAKRNSECKLSRTTAVMFLIYYADHLDELGVWFMVKDFDADKPGEYVGLQTGDVDVDFLREVAFGKQYTRFALWRISR